MNGPSSKKQKNPLPVWVEGDDIDLEYHVRHAALPWPGGERELGELVGRLQSTPVDLTRPPWECTIIEGLEGQRFALFVKMHHSVIDGISGIRLLQRAMSPDRARSLKLPPFWASGAPSRPADAHQAPAPTYANVLASAFGALSGTRCARCRRSRSPSAASCAASARAGRAWRCRSTRRARCSTAWVREKRRFATQRFPIERLRGVATAAQCTLNDVVLAICGGALRRFLHERDSLPEPSLTAAIPVSVRPKDDGATSSTRLKQYGTHAISGWSDI